jgi:hypothetical protein
LLSANAAISGRWHGLSPCRVYLTAAYQHSKVTLLEREYVDILQQEMRLDLAGLTEERGTNTPVQMQSS